MQRRARYIWGDNCGDFLTPLRKGSCQRSCFANKHNPKLVPFAKQLRKNMTEEERRLWYGFLRNYPVRFTRQKILGRYIADFYCASAKLVIELDGSQHYEAEGIESDEKRSAFLREYGLRVLRIPNNTVTNNFRGVCEYVDAEVKKSLGITDM